MGLQQQHNSFKRVRLMEGTKTDLFTTVYHEARGLEAESCIPHIRCTRSWENEFPNLTSHLARVDDGEELRHVVPEVEQVDEGEVVERQRLEYLVAQRLDGRKLLRVHVREPEGEEEQGKVTLRWEGCRGKKRILGLLENKCEAQRSEAVGRKFRLRKRDANALVQEIEKYSSLLGLKRLRFSLIQYMQSMTLPPWSYIILKRPGF